MSNTSNELDYDPFVGPDAERWRQAPDAERTGAIKRWLRDSGLPPSKTGRESVERWRRVEDALATDESNELTAAIDGLIDSNIGRAVAVWAASELVEIDDEDDKRADGDSTRSLMEPVSRDILPAAFEAWNVGLSAAHEAVIEHYHREYAPRRSMNVATAAGFCFGCAASPKFVRNHVLHRHFFGGELEAHTPVWLPVVHAYEELFRFVSDAVFEETDAVPASVKPPTDPAACFEPPFRDWCLGFLSAGTVVKDSWAEHLDQHPRLKAEHADIVDTLSFFASDAHARRITASMPDSDASAQKAARKRRDRLETAATRLFVLAQPVLRPADSD